MNQQVTQAQILGCEEWPEHEQERAAQNMRLKVNKHWRSIDDVISRKRFVLSTLHESCDELKLPN